MNSNNDEYRNHLFLELLALGKKDPGAMMDKVHDVLLTNGIGILSPDNSKDEIINSLNKIMKWFEKNEKYEKCNTIKKIIDECLESM
jgi:hypothetical protein